MCVNQRFSLTCILSLKAKNVRKTFIFTQLKISRYNQNFFAIFGRILNLPPTYLLCIRPVVPHATAKSDGTSASYRTKTHRRTLPYSVHVCTARKLSTESRYVSSQHLKELLVSWCFEPSQPQRIISGLKTSFNLSSEGKECRT